MTQKIIPAGYRLTVHSWENDGDSPSMLIKEGIQEDEICLHVELLNLMKKRGSGLENNYEPTEKDFHKAHSILLPLMEKYAALFDEKKMALFRKDVGSIQNYIAENLTGYPNEEYGLRVVDSFSVEYLPEQVIMENALSKVLNLIKAY